MRVCLVSRELWPFYGAGIGAYAHAMASAWAAAGHDIHVVTGRWPDLHHRAAQTLPGVHVHPVQPPPAWRGLVATLLHAERPLDFERYAQGVLHLVARLHAQSPFDLVEVPDYWAEGLELVRRRHHWDPARRARLLARLHSPTRLCRQLNDESPRDEIARRLIACEEHTLRGVDTLVSPTHALLELVRRDLSIHTMPGEVIPYPFDPAPWRTTPEPRPQHDEPEVLYFGRLERRKGVELLIEAALALMDQGRPIRVRLIGGDTLTAPGHRSMRAALDARLAAVARGRFAPRFTFEPPRPRPELLDAIRRADLCCFPSRWENFPNACLEAMAAGAPVIGSDAGGMAEIIQPGVNGLTFRSGDAADLQHAIARLLDDPALRQRLADAAPRRITTLCDPHTIANRTAALAKHPGRDSNARPAL